MSKFQSVLSDITNMPNKTMQQYIVFIAGGVITLSATSAMQAETNAINLGYTVVGVAEQINQ